MKIVLIPALLLSCLCGCGYSTRSLLPSHIRRVAVVSVTNGTTQPGLAEELTDSLYSAFRSDRNLLVTGTDNAELLLSVTLTSYSRVPAVYDAAQSISGYELSISASFESDDRLRNEPFTSGQVSARLVYNPNREDEPTAASRVIGQLSRDLVRSIITAW
ncbi:MAG: LPS assembly lipoprotein LptE [candidate division WOR-3 bacterium]